MIDYIIREEAILALLEKGQHSKRYKIGETWELNFAEIQKAIKAIPSADVVPRKDYVSMERTVDKLNKALAERNRGKWDEAWLDQQYAGCRPRAIYCSNCHIVSAFKTPFCPNCGAMMEEN